MTTNESEYLKSLENINKVLDVNLKAVIQCTILAI